MKLTRDPLHDIEAMNQGLKGLTYVSSGPCPGCSECGLIDVEDGRREMTDEEYDQLNEPFFSRNWCELCNSNLAGARHPVHGRDSDDHIIHFDVCPDCLMEIQ